MTPLTGYRHPAYAESLRPYGEPVRLAAAGGSLQWRAVEGGGRDLVGPYPLFFAENIGAVADDCAALAAEGAISVVFVLDPFERDVPERLAGFDVVSPFKTHFLARLDRGWDEIATKYHRYRVRRALKDLRFFRVEDVPGYADTFWSFYEDLIVRREIEGPATLSRDIVRRQFAIPGAVVFEARDDEGPVGAGIWYEMGEVAYNHLHAQNDRGFAKRAGFGLYHAAIEYFRGRVDWLDYGGTPGTGDDPENGLHRFKSGWSTDTRPAWLCGKVLDRTRYEALAAARGTSGATFFPAYRAPVAGAVERAA